MNNKTILITLTSACLMGFATSKLSRSRVSDEAKSPQVKQVKQEEVTVSKRVRKPSDRPSTRTKRTDDLLTQLDGLRTNELRAKTGELDVSEIQALMEAVGSRGDAVTGLKYPDYGILRALLSSFALKDVDASVAWVMGLENKGERRNFISVVVEAVGEANLEEGLALMESVTQTYGERAKRPFSLLDNAAMKDADSLLRLYAAGANGSGNTMKGWQKYADDFDFEKALNGLANLNSSLPEGKSIIVMPNLLDEWVKRDPQGAMEWAVLGKDLMFNNGMRDFMASYKREADDAELVEMVSAVHNRGEGYRNTWNALSGAGSEAVFEQFLEAATADGGQNQLVEGLLGESMGDMRGEDRMVRKMLLDRLDAQQRMEFFTGENAPKPTNPKVAEQLRVQLVGLGHSPEEIERMIIAEKQE